MSVKVTLKDGYWYVDVRLSATSNFKSRSRHPRIEDALEDARLFALTHGVEL